MKMKHKYRIRGATAFMAVALVSLTSLTASAAGLMKPIGQDDGSIKIKSHAVRATINNGFARTEVDQVFHNSTTSDREAIYTFPIPNKASLSEVSLWIDGTEVIGEVLEKGKARKVYEEEVSKGNETALAEKNDFMTFDISVGVVRANSDTRVRLVYYQPLEIDLNIGRYVYPIAEGGVDDARIPFWEVDSEVTGSFSFDMTLKSAFPVKDVRVPGLEQQAMVSKTSSDCEESVGDVYSISISENEGGSSLTRDIVVYYRLDDTAPARVELVPYRASDKEDGTFMVVVTPAADLKRITKGTDWVFVLDKSGSMSGGKIATLTDGVGKVLGKMSPNDRFQIVTFNNAAQDFTGGFITATPENVQKWITKVRSIAADGGTALFAGLEEGCSNLDEDRTTGLILVTDGVCNVGPTQQAVYLDLIKKHDIRLFTFVIGNSANRPLLERMAKDSRGFAMNISDSDDIVGRLIQAKAKVLHECMHDVELKFRGERVKQLTPEVPGSLYVGQQLVMFGRYNGEGEVDVELKAKISGQERTWHCKATLPKIDQDNPELERLWALSQIEDRMEVIREKGESAACRKTVVDLATEYSLVTDYTSMIVLREDVMEERGIQRNNTKRVQRERKAQKRKAAAPVRKHRVDNGKTFKKKRSPGLSFGTGPVGPLFLCLMAWLVRKKKEIG